MPCARGIFLLFPTFNFEFQSLLLSQGFLNYPNPKILGTHCEGPGWGWGCAF